MEKSEIFEKIQTILSDLLEIDPAQITHETRLREDLNADSLLYLEFFEEMKDEFSLDITARDVGKYAQAHPVATVGQLTVLVQRFITDGAALMQELENGVKRLEE